MTAAKFLLNDAAKALESGGLLEGLHALVSAATLLRDDKATDELGSIRQAYELLLKYFAAGADDPERDSNVENFFRRAYRQLAALRRRQKLVAEPEGYFAQCHKLAAPYIPADGNLADGLQAILSEAASPLSDEALDAVFATCWTAPLLTQTAARDIERWLLPSAAPSAPEAAAKLVAVSALTLSSLHFCDTEKLALWARMLHTLYAEPSTYKGIYFIHLKVRALVALAFSLIRHGASAAVLGKLQPLIATLEDSAEAMDHVELLQMQLLISLETKSIQRSLEETIIPGFMKHLHPHTMSTDSQSDDEPALLDMNEEWQDEASEERQELSAAMRQIENWQAEGADLYVGAFTHMKHRFPFFSHAANWFVPFMQSHPGLQGVDTKDRLAQLILRGAHLCDSDRYSVVLAMGSAGKLRDKTKGFVNRWEPRLQEFISQNDDVIGADEEVSVAVVLRYYLQNFFRFSHTFLHHSDFVNPFKLNLLLTDCESFSFIRHSASRCRRVADYAFKVKNYGMAAPLYAAIAPDRRTAESFEREGYALEQTGHVEDAADRYRKAADMVPQPSYWLCCREADCQRKLGLYPEASTLYLQAADMKDRPYRLLLRAADCLMRLSRFGEAARLLYEADYKQPHDPTIVRPLAWCELQNHHYEKAEKHYAILLTGEDATCSDWLNAGHVALLDSRLSEALKRYGMSAKKQQKLTGLLDPDTDLLIARGIHVATLRLVRDVLAANHPGLP